MPRYLFQRLVQAVVTILIVTLIIFVIVRLIGDPTHLMLPPEATEADRELLRHQMGLSDPVIVQYGRFLLGLLHGDLGMSYRFSRPALDVVMERIGPTLILTMSSLGLGILVGVPLGVASAVRPDSWIDLVAKLVALLGQAAPPFFFGLVLVLFLSVHLGLLPTSGYGGIQHLVMPAVALGWYSSAGLMRLTRSNMLEVLGSEYVKMARIKGLPERVVIYKHALKNAALPVLTFASLQFGILMGGAVSIESVFAWPGMGKLILDSIANLDYTVVQAAVTVAAVIFTLINLAVDMLYAYIDPRIRYA
ncbi:ABC transporter permease [Xanthobacter sp. DSM 24535]|uniref:ABC transporter permease n=1 Tax=Roseixanthobacter psychrophilus TaxID=3119917 RepID=UPI0037271C64